MKKFLSFIILLFVADIAFSAPLVLEEKDPIKLNAYGLFYSKPMGSVAFLPKVGDERYLNNVKTYYFLPESGYYKLPKKGNLFFRVNHYSNYESFSYLAVIVYIIYPSSYTHRNQVFLTRNVAEWGPGEQGRKLDALTRGPKTPNVTLDDFFKAHDANTNSALESDKILTFTWHAAVEPGSIYSWEYKKNWRDATPPSLDSFLEKLSLSKQDYKAAITSHIIRFKASQTDQKPLDFYFNVDFAKGVYLYIFSPLSPYFEKEFYFSF